MPGELKSSGQKSQKHIVLTSHPSVYDEKHFQIHWGASTPEERGPIIGSVTNVSHRNVIGAHSGSYTIYRALAVAAGKLDPEHRPDLTNTAPTNTIGPFPSWQDPGKIVSLDPYGGMVGECFREQLEEGYDIRPTIAITRAHITLPELQNAIKQGRLKPDGKILLENGNCVVTKAAVEPVWYLPGIAERFGVKENELRQHLFERTGGMYTELVTRRDLNVFLPPIGGQTAYFFGEVDSISDPEKPLACRVHDECNGSDVFGSDICTCRPYLTHGIEVCIECAQKGGAGVVVYNRKEGRALGEVTKFLVYNARKRQQGGDTADAYFERTECVAGVQDMRFQELMPDLLHWLGITKIDSFVSMSNLKYDSLVASGIEVGKRISLPAELIPDDAQVEMAAKKAAGYYTDEMVPTDYELKQAKGRIFL
ncbi:MAG: GTP cyclohydrolase II [SAR324 cluster bacterium]|nr:GTP cyclohydrolase II [SAR324 cluster bacterium]